MLYNLLGSIKLSMNGYEEFIWSSYGMAVMLLGFLVLYSGYKKLTIKNKLKIYFVMRRDK